MVIVEGIAGSFIAAVVYDGLKCGGKTILGPYAKTFQKAQKEAQKQLKKEFTKGELLSIFTTFNNFKWKLSFGKQAREEIERNLIKGVEALDGQVFVDELIAELHENNKQYNIELVKKVISRFVETVSQELKTNQEIRSYLRDIKLDKIKEKIDELHLASQKTEKSLQKILEGQKRLEKKLMRSESQ